ncbi:MAG: DedA family protein [Rhodospirillales bacterium]
MDLAEILDLIRRHGDVAYGFVFAYAGANSLLMALFAGYAAHTGAFDLGTLVAVCWAGSVAGDAVRFWIGRRWGPACLRYFPRIERAAAVVARLIDRHNAWMILVHRYPHGLRGVAGFAYGISPVSWTRFLVLNFVSAGIWAVGTLSAGYSFGHVSEKTLGEAASGLSLAVLVAFLALAWLLSKKLERAIERG